MAYRNEQDARDLYEWERNGGGHFGLTCDEHAALSEVQQEQEAYLEWSLADEMGPYWKRRDSTAVAFGLEPAVMMPWSGTWRCLEYLSGDGVPF